MSNPQHHWLVAGEIVTQNKQGEVKSAHMNAIVQTKHKCFCVPDIGKAQQILQLRFHEKVHPDPAEETVIDVFLYNVSHLGLMDEKTFQKGFSAAEEPATRKYRKDLI